MSRQPHPYRRGRHGAYVQPPHVQAPSKSGMPSWVIALIVVGVLLLVLVMGIRIMARFLAVAPEQTLEATSTVAEIARSAVSAYGRDGKICPSASSPVPPTVPRGIRYIARPTEYPADATRNAGFACLRFEMGQPQYYQYTYEATPTSFKVTAHGDINGDGVVSTFQIEGKLQGTKLVASPMKTTNPGE